MSRVLVAISIEKIVLDDYRTINGYTDKKNASENFHISTFHKAEGNYKRKGIYTRIIQISFSAYLEELLAKNWTQDAIPFR